MQFYTNPNKKRMKKRPINVQNYLNYVAYNIEDEFKDENRQIMLDLPFINLQNNI